MLTQYETIVIGAGPAGLQAALFLARAKIKTLVVGDPHKSDLASGREIGNYFGIEGGPPGIALLDNGVGQIKNAGAEILIEEVVDVIQKSEGNFLVTIQALKQFSSRVLIVASGAPPVRAGISGEEQFLGKGLHTCVACDGPLFAGKNVLVLGNGSHAAQEALELLAHTKNVSIYSQGKSWEVSNGLREKLLASGIQLSDKRVKKIQGERFVSGIILADGTEEAFEGIFVAFGKASGITFAFKLGLELNEQNFVTIDRDGKTNIQGVWAAGGVCGGNPQIAKSVGEGCNAAISIIRTLRGIPSYTDQT